MKTTCDPLSELMFREPGLPETLTTESPDASTSIELRALTFTRDRHDASTFT